MNFLETCCVVVTILWGFLQKQMGRRQCLVDAVMNSRMLKGHFSSLHEDLKNYPTQFHEYYKMSISNFFRILEIVGPKITYTDSRWTKTIPAETRLSVTLRYLASGDAFNSLDFDAATVRAIVLDTCKVIWECLQPLYMGEKSQKDWMDIAERFEQRTYFPNCIGVVSGFQIPNIKKPTRTKSEIYDYRNFFSIVLLGVVDADCCFTAIDVGAFRGNSDATAFKNSSFYQKLRKSQLNVPNPQNLPHDEEGEAMPFVLLGDESLGPSEHVLRPFSSKNLSIAQKVYNYRLKRGRLPAKCAFNMLANNWKFFNGPMDVKLDFLQHIVKACCILHNFLRHKDVVQSDNKSHEFYQSPTTPANKGEFNVREYFSNYFITPQGSMPSQQTLEM